MLSVWLLVLVVGASARLTRLVTVDTIAGPFRAWFIGRYGPDSKPATLVACPWCIGFWLTAAVTLIGWLAGDAWWFVFPALVLTGSYLVGLLARIDH